MIIEATFLNDFAVKSLTSRLNRDTTKEGIASSIADPNLDALTGELTRALLTAPWWAGFARKCLL